MRRRRPILPLATDRTRRVLDYFDGINLAARATTPARYSVALRSHGLLRSVSPRLR